MKTKSVFFIFLFIFCFVVSEGYAQCTCASKYRNITPSKEFEYADIVFVGKIIELKKSVRDTITGSYTETVKFEVSKIWKADSPKIITVVNKIQGCLNGFEKDQEWLVYGYKNSAETFATGCCCSRTSILSKAAEDLKEFDQTGVREMKILEEKESVKSPGN